MIGVKVQVLLLVPLVFVVVQINLYLYQNTGFIRHFFIKLTRSSVYLNHVHEKRTEFDVSHGTVEY